MNKFKLSAIASTVLLSAAIFTGCGSSSAGGSNIQAADGYVVKLVTAATATCGDNTVSSTTVGAKGKISFDGISLDETCTISVPSDAIIDVNNNGVYDASIDKASGFEMKANGAATVVSHLTTLVESKRAAGEDVSALAALVNSYDPVTALGKTVSTTGTENIKFQNLVKLGEVAKTILSSKSSAGISKIDVTKFIQTTTVITSAEVTTAVTVPEIDTTVVTTVNAAEASIAKIIELAPSLPAAELDAIFTLASDGDETITDAIEKAGATAPTTAAAIKLINEADQAITQKQVAQTKSGTTVTQSLNLGDTLTFGSESVTLGTDGTFTKEITTSSSSKLSDYFNVSFNSADLELDATFATQTIALSIEITNINKDSEMVKLTVPGIQLSKGTGKTISLTIPTATTVSATQTGLTLTSVASGATVTSNTTSALVNSGLTFDVNSVISALGSNEVDNVISELNDYLRKEGTYSVSIKATGNDISVLPIEFTTITGTIEVKN